MAQTPYFTEIELGEIYLEISSETQVQVWQNTQRFPFSTPSRHWHAYLNQLCLDTFLTWLHDEYPQAKSWTNPTHCPSFWEFVNGCAILLHERVAIALPRTSSTAPRTTRLVLIPSTAMDTDELRVPQEWVDIPSWAGDYYLAAQVEPDEGWLRIWGFTTHERLKTWGEYDTSDRTYSLSVESLTPDLDVLWEVQTLCPNEITRAAIAPLPALLLPQAETLMIRLSNPQVILPRLEVPFAQWGALLKHAGWRQRLYQRRAGIPEQWSIRQWLSGGIAQIPRHLGWEQVTVQPGLAGARGAEMTQTPESILLRQLIIGGQSYELRIIPEGDSPTGIWRFELRKSPSASTLDLEANRIPRGMKLRLLTEDLQPFAGNEAIATAPIDRLYLVVALEPGEGLVWEIDPTPENYEREILLF